MKFYSKPVNHVTAPSWNPGQLTAPWATLPLQQQVTRGRGCDPIEQSGVAKAAQAPALLPFLFLLTAKANSSLLGFCSYHFVKV